MRIRDVALSAILSALIVSGIWYAADRVATAQTLTLVTGAASAEGEDYRTIRLTDEQSSHVAQGHDAYDSQVVGQIGANLRENAMFFAGALSRSQQRLDELDAEMAMLAENWTPAVGIQLREMEKTREVLASQVSTWSFHSVRSQRAWELFQEMTGSQ